MIRSTYLLFTLMIIISCQSNKQSEEQTQFSLLDSSITNIDFENNLSFNEDFNIYTYRNFYNGGGVAIADFNNDGLNDLYFTANMKPNELYINNGQFKFTEVAKKAGVQGTKAWSTGVSVADINSDGWLDIYVCNSGDIEGDDKMNELFINNQDGTFTEQAAEFGLADEGFSTHAAFFDYDRDGDLDCYVLNNSYRSIGSFNLKENERTIRDEKGGDKLYQNQNGRYVDVSEQAGIFSSEIGFGLGVTIGDINLDGWLDIFISNDFFERDYLYINQQNGTFSEELTDRMKSTSAASMGADLVDLNNDFYPELFVTEMLPENNERLKTKTTFESWDKYQFKLKNGYYHQFTRNMLQLNTGNEFLDISRFAGVEATDWSWASLGADFDLDGHKEIFVANGIFRDLTDQDFIMYASSPKARELVRKGHKEDFNKLIEIIPSKKISNYLFKQIGTHHYENVSKQWGLSTPSHSNGAAYGDLDNDGDLDLVVNNVNMPAFIYQNNQQKHQQGNYIKLKLIGDEKNPFAYGAKIFTMGETRQFFELMPIRGFQSTMAQEVIIPEQTLQDNRIIYIQWPTGELTEHTLTKDDEIVTIDKKQGTKIDKSFEEFTKLSNQEQPADDHRLVTFDEMRHEENHYSDFDHARLLYKMNSRQGPKLAIGDVNGDGLSDLYLGGAKGQPGQLYHQLSSGTFKKQTQDAFMKDRTSEDTDAVFLDVDNDQDLDLYVVSGGSEFSPHSTDLLDRLYINQDGVFQKSEQLLPTASKFESGSCVVKADFNQDGWIDLFVGTRLATDAYGVPTDSYLLVNNQDGGFTQANVPELKSIGLVTDATISDLDNNGTDELIIVGEYMGVHIFTWEENQLVPYQSTIEQVKGWWNTVSVSDVDKDGDMDILLGNHGLNSRFKATKKYPIQLYINDFDKNGSVEQLLTGYNNGKSYPMALRHDLIQQLPYLKEKFLRYEDYKNATVQDIFTNEQIKNSVVLEANELRSGVLINNQTTFRFKPLSDVGQFSCINSFLVTDSTTYIGGNQYAIKPEVGRQDALKAIAVANNNLDEINHKHQLPIDGVITDIKLLKTKEGSLILFARNNDTVIGYEL